MPVSLQRHLLQVARHLLRQPRKPLEPLRSYGKRILVDRSDQDLVAPGGAPRASAQVLWSRSRGLVFSGSRLPAAPEGRTYQLWLMSGEGPISAGLVASEAAGPLTRGFDPPERLPRPVTGALLTLEPAGGSTQPSNTIVLSTPPKAPPTS